MNARLNTQTVPISKLVPLPGNPRKTLKPDDPGWRRIRRRLHRRPDRARFARRTHGGLVDAHSQEAEYTSSSLP